MLLGPYLLILLAAVVQEEMACIGAALASVRGDVHWLPALTTCVAGTWLVDLFYVLCGRFGGRWLVARPPLRWLVPPERLDDAIQAFGRYGSLVVLLSRFMPGLRTPLQVTAGLIHGNLPKAIFYLTLACAIYVPMLFGLTFLLGETILEHLPLYGRYGVPVLAVAGLILCLAIYALRSRVSLSKHKTSEKPL